MPFARATGIGSTFDCAVHSKSVCFFDKAIISSPVMVLCAVSVAIAPAFPAFQPYFLLSYFPTSLELAPGLPIRKLIGLRHTIADREEDLQVFTRAIQVPTRQDHVSRRVVTIGVPVVPHPFREVRRLADVVDACIGVER